MNRARAYGAGRRTQAVAQYRHGASRDYSDPIAGARALGRLPQLLAALTVAQPG